MSEHLQVFRKAENYMDEYLSVWEPVLRQLKRDHGDIVRTMVDWFPSGHNELTIKVKNGTKYRYSFIGSRLRKIEDVCNNETLTEQKWRDNFSNKLIEKMSMMGISQWELARLSGISEVSLSRYMNGKASPSGYNLERIANALQCSSFELTRR